MFRLRVLGGFALEGQAGAPAPPLPQRRAEALLAVLAVCGDLGCTRERLVALLWPESDEAHARHSLRDALRAIRQTVGPRAIPSVGDFLRLDPAVVVSDVASFTQAVRSGRYRDAVSAYAGPLLDGFHVDQAPEFERWLDGERTRLAREYGEALQQLATAAEDAGAWDEAAGWWARAVEHDPHNSHLVLRHMDALAAMGDRANAIRAADAHVRRLREELDLEPDREVLVGIDRIRRGEVPEARPQTAPEPSASVPSVAPTAGTAPNAMLPARGLRRLPLWAPWTAALAAVVLAGVLGIRHWLKPRAIAAGPPRTAIAVLPFQNLTADTAHAYFAGGLHDELLTQLAKVAALTVVGPTSVSGYRQTSKPLRQIGEELGVGSIVEGSVQVVGNRLRVIVQLIEPVSETRLWAEHYDRTLEDAFAVESDIAQRIVGGLGATLTSAEASALAAVPTRNAEAYQFYLQGLDYWRRPGKERANLEIAQQLYERALRLDSTFALAHAALSLVHRDMHSGFYDPSPARAELQRREAEVALRLAPDLPQAHLAMGVVDVGRFDHGRALEELGVALRGAPNDAEVWKWIGYAYRGLGDWDSALVAFDHASRLEPRDVEAILDRGYTLEWVRRYGEAIAAFRQALALAPDVVRAHLEIGWAYMKWKGGWDTLRTVVASLPVEAWPEEALWVPLLLRQPDTLLVRLRRIHGPEGAPRYGYSPRAMLAAWAYLLRGDSAAAHTALDSAVTFLDSVERAWPDDDRVHAARGQALAALGRRAEAMREARWLERSDAYRDQFEGPWTMGRHNLVLVRLGETDAALAELEQLLARPSMLSVYELRLNPLWDPIRNDPRFQALLAKYANPGAR
jgi:TolB-like protein/DNA-binding SARP family transcriptional activator/Flp pilus assembly protein TadD